MLLIRNHRKLKPSQNDMMTLLFFRTSLWFLIWCLCWVTLREHRSTSHRFSPTVVRYLNNLTRKIHLGVIAAFWACLMVSTETETPLTRDTATHFSSLVSRPQNTRQFFSTMVPFRTLLLCSSPPPIRYQNHWVFQLQSAVFCPSYSLSSQVQMQALKCCSVLAYENTQVSTTLVNGKESFASKFI